MLPITRHVAQTPAAVWDALVDVRRWPQWGPSIVAARVDDGGHRIHAKATGQVKTPVGLWIPFQVTSWEDNRSWAWSVAHIPATAHRIEATDQGATAATIEVPWWAAPYGALCWIALGRLDRASAS